MLELTAGVGTRAPVFNSHRRPTTSQVPTSCIGNHSNMLMFCFCVYLQNLSYLNRVTLPITQLILFLTFVLRWLFVGFVPVTLCVSCTYVHCASCSSEISTDFTIWSPSDGPLGDHTNYGAISQICCSE